MTLPIGALSFPTAPLPMSAVAGQDVAGAASVGIPPNVPGATGGGFADILTQSLDQLQAMRSKTDALAQKAATGDLQDAHDYMIASQQSGLATEMVVTLRNKGVEAFTEIMRMQI